MQRCDFNKVAKQLCEITFRHGCSPGVLLLILTNWIVFFFVFVSVIDIPTVKKIFCCHCCHFIIVIFIKCTVDTMYIPGI